MRNLRSKKIAVLCKKHDTVFHKLSNRLHCLGGAIVPDCNTKVARIQFIFYGVTIMFP